MKLGLIGAGNMASALARGIGAPVLVSDIDDAKARALAEELGGEPVGSNTELAERADAILLCHKPKQLDEVAAEVGSAHPRCHDDGAAERGLPRCLDLPLHPEYER